MRHSEATRVLHKHEAWKGLQDGQGKICYVSERDCFPPGKNSCWSCMVKGYAQTRHDFGLTITVARQQLKTVSKLSFLTAVHTAKGIAKQEGVSEIFVCTAMTPWPAPTIPHPRPAVLRLREHENAASDRGRGARIAVRRNYATPSALVVWPGSPQPNHVVGMKTQR